MPNRVACLPAVQRFSQLALALVLLLCSLAPLRAQNVGVGPATGIPANGTYAGSPDQLNLGNLNLNLTIPLFKKAGRGIDYEFDLTYDSSVWLAQGTGWVQRTPGNMGWYTGVPQTRLAGTTYASYYSDNCAPPTRFESFLTVFYDNFAYTTADGIVNTFPGTFSYNQCTGAITKIVGAKSAYGYSLTVTGGNSTAAGGEITDPSGNTMGVSFFANSHQSLFSPITDRNGNTTGTTSVNGYSDYTDTANTTPLEVASELYQNGPPKLSNTSIPMGRRKRSPCSTKPSPCKQTSAHRV